MKFLNIARKTILLLSFCSFAFAAAAQETWNETSAKEWLDKKEWKDGLKPDVFTAVNKVVFAQQYHKNKAVWDKAFAFLRDSDLTKIKPGKYPIDGDNLYAIITEAPSKQFDASAWESHRKYIDLHYIIKGEETIGMAPVSKATVTKPYNETTDNANYNVEGQYFLATPATFYLFFPQDAHRPNIKAAGYDVVKKIVLKIRYVE